MVCSIPSITWEDSFCFSISAITPLICSLGAPGCMMIIMMFVFLFVGARFPRPIYFIQNPGRGDTTIVAQAPPLGLNYLRPTLLQRGKITLYRAKPAAHDLCDLADLLD